MINDPSVIHTKREHENYVPRVWNQIIGSSKRIISKGKNGESLMGNLVCDVMLTRTHADFAFISIGEIYADLYRGDITQLDMFRLFPFSRSLVVIEISGDTLKQIVEKTLGGLCYGLAIGGGIIEYDPARPLHNRLTYFQVGEYSLYPKKVYRVVTIDYYADGFAGFDMLKKIKTDRIFRTGVLVRDAVSDFIRQHSPLDETTVKLDNRLVIK